MCPRVYRRKAGDYSDAPERGQGNAGAAPWRADGARGRSAASSSDVVMDTAELVIGYLTGLALLAPRPLALPSLIATGVVVNVCDAIMCRLFARNNGYPTRIWTALGLVFGLWAVVVLILLPKRVPAHA
jgi:hypothetical protein